MKKSEQIDYLSSIEGTDYAERFAKALREGRIIASVKSVSRSGMSRKISFGEFYVNAAGFGYVLQFNRFFAHLGYKIDKNHSAITVNGYGMDMIFHTIERVASLLREADFDIPNNYSYLAEFYRYI